jgi:hypothetical protein
MCLEVLPQLLQILFTVTVAVEPLSTHIVSVYGRNNFNNFNNLRIYMVHIPLQYALKTNSEPEDILRSTRAVLYKEENLYLDRC